MLSWMRQVTVQTVRRAAPRQMGLLALLALAVAGLAGCDLGTKAAGGGVGGGGGGGTAAVIGPSTNAGYEVLPGTKMVINGTDVQFGPATFPAASSFFGGVRVTLQSDVGASIFYTHPTGDCAGVSTLSYVPYTGRFDVTRNDALPFSIGICFYATLGGVEGARQRITITHDSTPPVPTLLANGADPTGVVFAGFPTITMGFVGGGGTGDGTIHYTTDGSTPTVNTSARISVVNGAGTSSFVFSGASRKIIMLAEDLVGNVTAPGSEVAVSVLLGLTSTTRNSGYYATAQAVQIEPDPSPGAFFYGVSKGYLLLCQYALSSNAYECYDNTLAFVPGNVAERVPLTAADYPYDFGNVGTGDGEIITLPGIAGETVVYDLRFALDPLDSGTLDATQQAYYIIDRDVPSAMVYPDPALTDNDKMQVKTAVFDRGAFTVSSSQITNFALKADKTDALELCAGSLALTPPCLPVTPASAPAPSGSFLRPVAGSSQGDNGPVTVTVTATDGANNTSTVTRYLPIGRTVIGSPAGTAQELGYALAQGNFDCDAACRNTFFSGPLDPKFAPDVVVGEPGRDNGYVYIFYNSVRSEVSFASTAGVFATPLNLTAIGATTIPIGVDVDGATILGTIDLAKQLTTAAEQSSVSSAQFEDAFNKEILRLKVDGIVDLPLHMTSSNGAVTIRSNMGTMETCVTLDPGATGNLLIAALFGAGPVGPSCIYDDKIAGGTLAASTGERFGHAIVVADFNGDGFDDIAVGAPKYGNGSDAGRAYVFYVKTPATTPDFAADADSADTSITGTNPNDNLGWALAAGNFDNANPGAFLTQKDLVIGAPGFTNAGNADAGKVYLLLSGAAGFTAGNLDAETQTSAGTVSPQTETAYKPGERFGHALLGGQLWGGAATTDEVVVGAPGVETLAGTANLIDLTDPTTANPGAVFYYTSGPGGLLYYASGYGLHPDSMFGWSLAAVPSMFSDTCAVFKCLAIGAPHDEATGFLADNHGAVYIDSFGAPAPGHPIYGGAVDDELGIAVAGAGVNTGDTITDLIIGQRSSPVSGLPLSPAYGGLRIVKGRATTPATVTAARSFAAIDANRATGVREQSVFGWSLLPLDTDGDGHTDVLIVGAPGGAKKVGTGNVSGRIHVMSQQTYVVP